MLIRNELVIDNNKVKMVEWERKVFDNYLFIMCFEINGDIISKWVNNGNRIFYILESWMRCFVFVF